MKKIETNRRIGIFQQALFSHPKPLKLETGAILDPSHDKQEVRCQHEWNALPLPAQETLCVAQDVAKVDVKQVPCKKRRNFWSPASTTHHH